MYRSNTYVEWYRPMVAALLAVVVVGGCSDSTGGGDETDDPVGGNDAAETSDTDEMTDTSTDAGDTGTDVESDTGPSEPAVYQCTNVCETPDDCDPPKDDPSDWACEDGRCEPVSSSYTQVTTVTCSEDFDCRVDSKGCESSDDCSYAKCVHLRDANYCVLENGPMGCSGETIEAEEVGSGETVEVCLRDSLSCIEEIGICYTSCAPQTDSPDCPDGLSCRDDGVCVCQSDQDCTSDTQDTCYDGYCGCGDDAACDSLEDDGRPHECRQGL